MNRTQASFPATAWRGGCTALLGLLLVLAELPAQAQGSGTAAVFAGSGRFLESKTVGTGRAAVEDVRTDFDGASTRWTYLATAYADMNRGAVAAGSRSTPQAAQHSSA